MAPFVLLIQYSFKCTFVNLSKLCPEHRLVMGGNEVDAKGARIEPHLALIPQRSSVEPLVLYNEMEVWVDVRLEEEDDPFLGLTNLDDIRYSDEAGYSGATRTEPLGHFVHYSNSMRKRQHRLHLFSISICGNYARLLRWDANGCIFTERFEYREESALLLSFFWCYSMLTPAQRGFDPTVTPATAAEAKLLKGAITALRRECRKQNRRNVFALERPFESEQPWVASKIKVDLKGGPREFIVERPFWGSDTAYMRQTRAWAAYDMVERRLVFLKDCWRADETCRLSEAEIYKNLKKHKVPFLPTIISAGDIRSKGKIHDTVTMSQSLRKSSPEWVLPGSHCSKLIHYRIVQDLAFPIISALSSKEAVQSVRDIAEGSSRLFSLRVLHY